MNSKFCLSISIYNNNNFLTIPEGIRSTVAVFTIRHCIDGNLNLYDFTIFFILSVFGNFLFIQLNQIATHHCALLFLAFSKIQYRIVYIVMLHSPFPFPNRKIIVHYSNFFTV